MFLLRVSVGQMVFQFPSGRETFPTKVTFKISAVSISLMYLLHVSLKVTDLFEEFTTFLTAELLQPRMNQQMSF